VLHAVTDRRTTTFDFGDVEDSAFSDIDSRADRVVAAGRSRGSLYRRIRHEPLRTREGLNWQKISALVGIAALIATIALGVPTIV
jgi:hypothetical protein